jgi:molybdenum cofactor cytidylyltransferase
MGCLLKQGGGLYQRMRIGAVLLAAGEGRRMGGVPKALLQLQGVPLINRHLIALSGAGVDEVVVVTGHHHERIEPLVEKFPVRMVRNLEPERGQASSVRLGLERLGESYDAVIMMLCDQPLVGASELTQLMAAFKKRPHGEIVMPAVQGQRGNPVVISGAALSQILQSGKNMVCRKYMDDHPEQVHVFECDNERFVIDVDTLEEVAAFEQRTGWALTLPVAVETSAPAPVPTPVPVYMALQKIRA